MYRDSDTYDEIKKVIIQIYLDYDIRNTIEIQGFY